MKYDEKYKGYVVEYSDVVICWKEDPMGSYSTAANDIRNSYVSNLKSIAKAIYSELKDAYTIKKAEEVILQLGRPLILPEQNQVIYCENSFDKDHIISFEYADRDFSKIKYVSVDG